MLFAAHIDVMPLEQILDPQGKAVLLGLQHLHISNVQEVRIGRSIAMKLEADTEEEARKKVEQACQKLLANPIMEGYSFTLSNIG
jgi:phosphoribosylformylglycinamidine synthase subunit PurS